jgi:ABC-2 type transport system permease protein
MTMNRIRTIIDKEWAEVFKNRLVIFTVGLLPLIFTALPLIILYATRSASGGGGSSADMPPSFAASCGTLSSGACMQIYIINEFLLFYMMMPVIIPITIAAYSIVGEKTTRSLEPLLATPISTTELLVGKGLAASIPAILATWVSFGIFAALVPVVGGSAGVESYILSSIWLLAVIVAGPLMAILSVNFALFVSSRVNDPRVAEQISAVLILPILLIFFGQLAGFVILSVKIMLLFILALAVIDVGLVYLGVRLFQREAILTRWK